MIAAASARNDFTTLSYHMAHWKTSGLLEGFRYNLGR